MDLARLQIRALRDKTCLDRFDCGSYDINNYARNAHKNVARRKVRVFAAHDGAAVWGLGFYAVSLMLGERGLPVPGAEFFDFGVPLAYLEVLGVRQPYQNAGIGRLLLIDALRRIHHVSGHVPLLGVALRSMNDRTTAFYEQHGFGIVRGGQHPLMVLPIFSLDDLFAGAPPLSDPGPDA